MKILATTLLYIVALPFSQVLAQEKTLPEIIFPVLPNQPNTKKGWVGQFVYQLQFNDSSSGGKGNDKVYYHIIVNRINSGYVELSSEVRGAIRNNQPDKNNVQRYESWIGNGTKKSWSRHDETDTIIVPTAIQGRDGIIGRLEKYIRCSSNDEWIQGWLTNTDLQIDHTTGKYSFGVPLVDYEMEADETTIDISNQPVKKVISNRKVKKKYATNNVTYLTLGEWNMLEGDFKEGQQEIIIRQRIPVTLQPYHNDRPLAPKKGFMDFFLVLKKIG